MWGELAIVLENAFLNEKKLKNKLLIAIGFAITGISYIFTFYPAWEVSMGYIFLVLFIHVLLKNKNNYKISKKDILLFILIIAIMATICIRYFLMSQEALQAMTGTKYPGKRFETGGGGKVNTFSYVFNIFTPYKEINNPCEKSTMISYYPIPMIIAFLYMIRNKKGYSFIAPLLVLACVYSVWSFISTNEFLAKITLLYMVKGKRISLALSLIQSYLIIYLLGNVERKDFSESKKYKIITCIISLILSIVVYNFAVYLFPEGEGYLDGILGIVATTIVFVVFYLMFTINTNKNKLLIVLAAVSIFGGIYINPIAKGIDVMTNKPVAQKIREIANEHSDSIWITDNYIFPISNYVVSNGAKTLNTTNYYPNEKLMYKLFGDEKETEEINWIYNRYSHMLINLVEEETKLELLGSDHIKIYLNVNDLEKIDVEYILTGRSLEEFNNENMNFELIYSEDGFNIYNVIYK